MIKRIIACLTICLIVTGLFNPVISHAEPIPIYTPNWDNPGIAEIINISDLTGWMANGGVYDITSFQNLDEFMSLYFKIRVPMEDQDGNISFAPYYGYETSLSSGNNSSLRFNEQSQIRGMIGRSYQNKTGYGRRLQEQVDKALLEDGNLNNVNIPLLELGEAAFFVGYNTSAIDQYKSIFYSDDDDNPQPEPDVDFSFISNVNNMFINGINIITAGDTLTYYHMNDWAMEKYFDFSNVSLFGSAANFNHIEDNQTSSSEFSVVNGIITINLTTNQDNSISATYTPQFNNFASADTLFDGGSSNQYNLRISYNQYSNKYFIIFFSGGAATNFQDSFAGLSTAINYIYSNFYNINLYVDGEPWVLTDSPSGNTFVPEFPDVVGGEELPTTTWPLTVPKAPSYINLPGLRQAFQRAKNTDNKFDIMDLVDSLVDPDGDPIVDPEMETVPIPLPNPDPINPEVVPELPDLPLIPPVNNPGFNGVSVLAEIINFTNQSLPSALITVFWGIIFGVVILGLIKILHK